MTSILREIRWQKNPSGKCCSWCSDAEHKVGTVSPANGDGLECTALRGGFKINLMIIIMLSNMTDCIALRAIKSPFMS